MHVMIVYDCASLYGCLPAMQLPMIIHLLFTDIFLSESPLQPPPLPAPTSACVAAKEIQARWESIRDSYTEDCRKVKSEIASGATPSRRYIFEQLSFLSNVVGSRTAAGGLPYPQSTDATEGTPQKAVNGDSISEPSGKRRRWHSDRHQCQQQQPGDDRDFFMSLLPAVRTLLQSAYFADAPENQGGAKQSRCRHFYTGLL